MSGHHRLILRLAAMIVPGTRRADWLAEWEGELFHSAAEPGVDRAHLTAFCWGAFRDAFWLWRHHPHRLQIRNSPVGCLLLLLVIVGVARAPGAVADHVPAYPAVGMFLVVTCAAVLTSVNTRLLLFLHPRTSRSNSTRGWLFFLLKIVLILASLHFALGVAASFAAWGAVQLLIVLCTFAFRWALRDQRARCPVCLRMLAKPVKVGLDQSGLLGWNGIEMMCCLGHGLLYVPESPSDHYHDPRWVTLDSSWRVLFDTPADR
jgi:hypothetical protein